MQVLLMLALLSCSVTAVAERTNPFAKPASIAPMTSDGQAIASAASNLELMGVLEAGHDSIANINGQLVGVGEGLNGYTLIAVGDGQAVLTRGGSEVTLTLASDLLPEERP